MKCGFRTNFLAAIGVFVLSVAVTAAGPAPFVYKSTSGTAFKVTGHGLSSITIAGKQVASGGWYFKAPGLALASATVKPTGSDRVTVVQNYGSVVATFDYAFKSDDLEIRAKVENNSLVKPVDTAAFAGLTFDFGTKPAGLMLSQSQKPTGSDIFYPSKLNPIGGSFATGKGFGVGLSPANPRLMRTLFTWDTPGNGGESARMLGYVIPETVPAEGARTYIMKMRVMASTDWKTLMQPYRDYFKTTFGDVQFTSDNRPVAYAWIKSSPTDVSDSNPYGYSEPTCRFDRSDVVKSYLDATAPVLKKANCQGIIFRGLAGYDSKGLEWLPYYNNLPPEIDDPAKPEADLILKQMTTAFAAAGVRTGMTGSPNSFDERATWTKNQAIRLNPDDPAHLDQMLRMRIKYFLDRNVDTFNFENIGSCLDDVKILKFIREKIGPDKQTFVSSPCDVALLYSGAYVDAAYDAKAGRTSLKMDQSQLDILRWLVPKSQFAIRFLSVRTDSSGESPVSWTYRNHMVPMLEDKLVPTYAEELHTLEANYLGDKWQWLD